jgi:hypothetical protein
MYSQVTYCLDRVPALVKAKPELAKVESFKTVMLGNREAMAKMSEGDLLKIAFATLTGMSVDAFQAEVRTWLAEARDPRWKKPYTELTYLPMQEVLKYLRPRGFKTYSVTGGGQDFVPCILEYSKAGDSARLSMIALPRPQARVRLPSGAGVAPYQGRCFHAGPLRRGEEAGLGCHQHEGRLETRLRVRVDAIDQAPASRRGRPCGRSAI